VSEQDVLNTKKKHRINDWFPYLLLTLVGILIFVTESNRGFVPGGLHSGVSIHGLALSKNLTNSEHQFFMFESKELVKGNIVYNAYNRFPIFPFFLTGLLISPFDHDLLLQAYIARLIMNIFYFLSIIVVFKLVDEMVKNKYIALSVSLLSFSSYYMLTYNNLIFNDIPALLGFVVALYCVVLTRKNKLKFSHICIFSLFPISLGWQPYAVFITWFIFDASELLFKQGDIIKTKLITIIKRPSFIILSSAILWGISVLGFQLLNEWRIIGGSFWNLPSVSSWLWRSGFISSEGYTQYSWAFDWINYLPGQAHTIFLMCTPFWPIFQIEANLTVSILFVLSLIVYNIVKYFNDRNQINKIHLIMIFSGLIWTIPMRRFVSLHDFQSIFYVGFIISLYTTILTKINLKSWNLLAFNITIIFIINLLVSNYLKTPNLEMNQVTSQFQNILNKLPENSKVYFDGDRQNIVHFSRYAIDCLLVGHLLTQLKDADYIISKNSNIIGEMLTTNDGFNLYKVSKVNIIHK